MWDLSERSEVSGTQWSATLFHTHTISHPERTSKKEHKKKEHFFVFPFLCDH